MDKLIAVPTTIEECKLLSDRHSDAYWFLQGDLTKEGYNNCCKYISDIEEALRHISLELQEQLERLDADF